MPSLASIEFHALHLRGGHETHTDCPICREGGYDGRVATVADLRALEGRLVKIMTQVFDDGLGSVRDALTEDEAAQQAADAKVEELLQELADAATNPAPADPGAVADIVNRIKALTARDVADSTATAPATQPPAAPTGTESAA